MAQYNYSAKKRRQVVFKRIRAVLILLVALALIAFIVTLLVDHFKKSEEADVPTKIEEVTPGAVDTEPETTPPAGEGGSDTPGSEQGSDQQNTPVGGTQSLSNPGSSDWRTVLVSAAYPLQKDLDVELTTVGNRRVDTRIADSLQAFLDGAKSAGYSLQVISGHRTFAKSSELYQAEVQRYLNAGYAQKDAEEAAALWVAPPGTSEHNTGLAVDIISADYYSYHGDLEEAFENDPEAIWMKEHCAEYGFILRYPKGKTSVTGIGFEPWHFRYVGVEAATYIMQNNLTLEEYLKVS